METRTEPESTEKKVPQYCRWCRAEIRMMCQRNTGFCCALHEKAFRKGNSGDYFAIG